MEEIFYSIVIPAFNAERYLYESVESALAQTYSKYEIIIVDDGSTDRTIEIAQRFGDRVKIIRQENLGASSARNAGVKTAIGNYIAFLDSDDIWIPNKLQLQCEKIEKGFQMVYTNRLNIGDKGDLPEKQTDVEKMPEGDIFCEILMSNFITNSSVVIDKKVFFNLSGFNLQLSTCEDWDLWLRYAANNRIGVCLEPLVKYRLHKGGKSRNYIRQAKARESIVSSILNTTRGTTLPVDLKKKIWASTYRTAGWASARYGDIFSSLKFYCKALTFTALDLSIWYDIARVISGRCSRN